MHFVIIIENKNQFNDLFNWFEKKGFRWFDGKEAWDFITEPYEVISEPLVVLTNTQNGLLVKLDTLSLFRLTDYPNIDNQMISYSSFMEKEEAISEFQKDLAKETKNVARKYVQKLIYEEFQQNTYFLNKADVAVKICDVLTTTTFNISNDLEWIVDVVINKLNFQDIGAVGFVFNRDNLFFYDRVSFIKFY